MNDPRRSPDTLMPVDSVEKPPVQLSEPMVVQAEVVVRPVPATCGTLHHWVFLLFATGVVLASGILSVRGETEVVVPWINRALPGTCTFLRVTGIPCPGCGLTRSFISLAHGHLRDAWHFNPAGMLFFAVVAFQIPYRTWQILRIRQGREEFRFTSFDHWTLVALIGLLLVQWLITVLTRLW